MCIRARCTDTLASLTFGFQVVVNGQVLNVKVLNVTNFLNDHSGGAQALLLYAGKEASEEFNMLHDPKVVSRYAPDTVIGTYKQ